MRTKTVQQLRAEFEEWKRLRYLPLLGADGAEDDEDDTEDEDDLLDDDDTDPAEEDEDDDDDDPTSALREQLAESERKRIAAEQAIKKSKIEAREARKKAAENGGDFERIAAEQKAELDELREQAAAAEEAKSVTEYELDQYQRKVRVVSAATRFHFRDPDDALSLLSEDDTGDDKAVERALRKLAEAKPYLVDQRKASGGPMGGGGRTGLTQEQIKSMTPEEINENWEAVQQSMVAGA